MPRRSLSRGFYASVVVIAVLAACGSEGDSKFDDGASSGFGSADGGSTLADGARVCAPPCSAGQKCSVNSSCIPEGSCAADGDCERGMVCDLPTNTCIPGGSCGAEEATGTSTPPNMLIVLDRSCSMTGKVGALTKWEIAVDALTTLVKENKGKIRFGLEVFPDKAGNECNQGALAVAVGPASEQKIVDTLKATQPDGPCVTNIDTAMQAAAAEASFKDKSRGNFAILLTDGRQAGCDVAGGDQGTEQILKDMFQKEQVPTFVIGFGDAIDPAQMNVFAVAGGAPRNDPTTKYYKAEDKPQLAAALAAIAKKTLSCVFTLSKTPPDPAKIFAFFDNKTAVPRDATKANGWEYDAASNTVTFYGQACDDLRLAKVTDVDIVFGCPEATPR